MAPLVGKWNHLQIDVLFKPAGGAVAVVFNGVLDGAVAFNGVLDASRVAITQDPANPFSYPKVGLYRNLSHTGIHGLSVNGYTGTRLA